MKVLISCVIQILLMTGAAFFYGWGGIKGKWKRRYISSFLVVVSISAGSLILSRFNYWLLLVFPLAIGTHSLGYGVNEGENQTLRKVLKRSLVVLASLTVSAVLVLTFGKPAVFLLPVDMIVGITSIYLGVRNPTQASAEEFQICLMLWLPKIFYLYI